MRKLKNNLLTFKKSKNYGQKNDSSGQEKRNI